MQSLSFPRFLPTEHPAGRAGLDSSDCARRPIGRVVAIAGAGAQVVLDPERLAACLDDPDPAVAMTGQVGGQLKIRTSLGWLLASVRDQRQASGADIVPLMAVAGGPSAEDPAGGEQPCAGGCAAHDEVRPAPADDPASTPAPSADGRTGIVCAIDFLGEGFADAGTGRIHGFRRGVTRYPIPGAEVFAAATGDLRQIHAGDGRAAIGIGTVYPTREIRAGLYVDAMLGRHFALLGSTGTGKSTATAMILHRICDSAPEGHVVMIDPHGEYAAAFGDKGEVFDVGNLRMPYWLMNFEEHCEVLLGAAGAELDTDREILARCLLQARRKSRLAEDMSKVTVDSPIPYLLSDLTRVLGEEMGRLDKAHASAPYLRIRARIDELRADPRYQFLFSGLLVGDTMAEFIARIFRLPSAGKPIAIIDVSGVPSDVTRTVVAVLARLMFDLAVWSRGEITRPILLVCEEAHRYVPDERAAAGSSVARILGRIAKEGRKYGIALGLVTQRPSDLAEGVLSQCGTIIAMRLNNERDQAFVRAAMPEGARGFLDSIPALRNREAIVCGEGVSIPIRLAFDDLEEGRRPASEDPSFSRLWQESGGEQAAIERAVRRWRLQAG